MKKKNLLKCLALTSMLALSVGAVTSCGTQGEAGKDGAQGEAGKDGAQGEQGEKGDDGKTYLEVIVVPGVVTGGGTIEQDKYYVQAGESFTLTFKNSEGKTPEVVFDFMINGVTINVEPGAESYTYTATASDTGFQVTSARFGTVNEYAKSAIYDEVRKLWESDKEIYLSADAIDLTHKLETTDKYASYAYYEISKAVDKAAADAVAATNKAIAAVVKEKGDDVTVADKVTACDTAIKASVTSIDAAYAKAIKDAKVEANKTLTELDNSLAAYTSYTAADKASILAQAKEAIESSTTLVGLSNVIDSFKGTNGQSIGKFTHTYEAKKECFDAVVASLGTTSIPAAEPVHGTAAEATTLTDLKAKLAKYGVSVDKLPNEVAAEWNAKISSEIDFPVYTEDATDKSYSKGDVIMGVEASKAIVASYSDVKAALKAAILKSYFDEIEASAILGDNGKVTMKGVVNSSINTWINTNDKDGSKKTLSQYMSTDPAELVGTIETQLATAIGANAAYAAFGTERIQNAISEVETSLSAELKGVMTGDYAKYVGGSMISASATKHKSTYKVPLKVGTKTTSPAVDAQFANPFVAGVVDTEKGTTADGDADYAYVAGSKIATQTVSITAPTSDPLNVGSTPAANASYEYDKMIAYDSTTGKLDTTKGLGLWLQTDGNDTPLKIKSLSESYTGIFLKIKAAAVSKYYDETIKAEITATASPYTSAVATTSAKAVFGDFSDDNYVISGKGLVSIFDGRLPQNSTNTGKDLTVTSVENIDSAMYSLYSKGSVLAGLESEIVSYASSFVTRDAVGTLTATSSDKHFVTANSAVAAVAVALTSSSVYDADTQYYTKSASAGTTLGGKQIAVDGYVYTEATPVKTTDYDATTSVFTNAGYQKYFTLSTIGEDVSGTLVEGTAIYKAWLDSSDSTSVVSKVLDGTYTTVEQIHATLSNFDSIYKAAVASYTADAKSTFKELYGTEQSGITALVRVQQLEKVYNGLLAQIGTDHSKDTSGSFADTTHAVNAKYKALFKGENCDSIDSWYAVAAKVLKKVGTADLVNGTVDPALGVIAADSDNNVNAMLLALNDAKVITLTSATVILLQTALA